jgi:hypothetical protein
MPTFINTQGQVVDLATGDIVGRAEGAPTQVEPRKAGAPEQMTEGADKVKGLINNLSWGFNSALFALPDATQRVIGRGLGLDDNQIFQFTKFFNRGEVAPRNSAERYSRAVGEGVGNTLPFTGILSAAAASRPLVTAAVAPTTLLRGIADDAIKMVQKSPRTAAAIDVAFGAGWEGLRQAVEENVSDENPLKSLYKELLPTAAFVGVPGAMAVMGNRAKQVAGMLPSVKAAGWAKDKLVGPTGADLSEVEKEALAGLGKGWRFPIVNIVPKLLMKSAESKLAKVFGPIAESKEAQEALQALETALADPRFANAGFVFDAAEKTMYTPLVQEKIKMLEQMGPKELEGIKERINKNQVALETLFSNLSPKAQKPVMEAFQAAQADRQAFFENLLRQKTDLTNAEMVALSERLGPQNLDMLNNELRGVIMSRMEADNNMRQKVLNRAGLMEATAPDGTPLPTRDKGQSLFPAQDMEDAVMALIKKYKPERPSMRISVPEPIRMLDSFVQNQLRQREQLERQTLTDLVDNTLSEQLAGKEFDPELMKALRDSVMTLVKGEKPKGGKRTPGLAELAPKPDAQGNISIPAIVPGRRIVVNPEQLRQDAARLAEQQTRIDLNLPEALDYLTAAQRFRNDSLSSYNAAMMKGRTRQTDAQRTLDTGDSVFSDIEKLVLDHSPKLKGGAYDTLKMMLDDYKQVYSRTLPLLMTQGKRGGMEYFLPNEDLLRNAFKNADSLRQVTNILGPDEQSSSLLMKGTIDWLRSKNVLNADGIVDPKKIRAVLDKNRNIVEALPQNIRAKLNDEVALADDYARRIAELDQRAVTAQDNELDRVLAKAVRPEADPRMVMTDALKDPAIMRKLVDVVGKDPENLAALRRSVYDIATEGTQGGGSLKSFIDNNEKALKILYSGTTHLQDLKTLADLQRRVAAFATVTGQIPAFESIDEGLKRAFGFGIQFGTTTLREAMVGRIAPETGALALLLRMTGTMQNQLYQRIFTRALESEEFAKQITHISTPKDAAKVEKQLADIGITKNMIFPEGQSKLSQLGRQGVQQTGGDILRSGEQKPVEGMAGQPVVPRETSASQRMLRSLPPAPPTTGVQFNPRLPTTPPVQQGGGASQIPLMYPAMFPNDPISALLQQRQALIQQPQQPQQPQR